MIVVIVLQKLAKVSMLDLEVTVDGEDLGPVVAAEIMRFVTHVLPVLMEIVRKGGRYREESVLHLRLSFRVRLHDHFWWLIFVLIFQRLLPVPPPPLPIRGCHQFCQGSLVSLTPSSRSVID